MYKNVKTGKNFTKEKYKEESKWEDKIEDLLVTKKKQTKLFIYLLVAEAIVGFVATLIVEFFPTQLISIFGAANESMIYTDFAVKSFRIYLCTMTLATVNKSAFIYLQSLGKALLSTALSMIREVIFGVGFALLLPIYFGLDGVLYSMPVSDILTFVISIICIVYIFKLLDKDHQKTLQRRENDE